MFNARERTRAMSEPRPVTVHYRVTDYGRITAYGCGASGLVTSCRTSKWRNVTCANCKRSKEWRAAQAPGKDKETIR